MAIVLAGVATHAAGQERLPRLTAIVIDGASKQAVFTDGSGDDPVSVRPGGTVGGYTVDAIRPGEAELSDASGHYRVEPSPHPGTRSSWAATLPPPPFIDPARREAETENDQ